MTPSFRFRYTNQLVGVFVLLVVLLLAAGVLLAGRAQRWFEAVYEIGITFPPEGTFGLQRGAEVHILGTPVGTVDRIYVDEMDRMHGVMRVRGEFVRFVREDSEAVVKRKFGIAGDAFVEIAVGSAGPLAMDPVPTIPLRRDTEIVEIVTEMVERVEGAILPAIDEAVVTLQEYRELARQMHTADGELQRSLAHVREILRGLEAGEGSAGIWLRDPSLAGEVQRIAERTAALAEEAEAAAGQVRDILSDVQAVSRRLPAAADLLEGELRDMPGTILQSRAALREAEDVLAGVQRHWLLRRYMDERVPLRTIDLDRIGHAEEQP